ncbi:MAG: fimbrillin family protein [Candidatus Cryptobacteroides sp.]
MKNRIIYILSALLAFAGCSAESVPDNSDSAGWTLCAKVSDMQGLPSTKVSYSGDYGEHTEFVTGDFFGLFVLGDDNSVKVSNLKVYCSGLDNDGNTVWSIFKEGSGEGNTSNYPMSDILGLGTGYFAYYPYDEGAGSISSVEGIRSFVETFHNALPSDQSASFTKYDFLVASNIEGCRYGEVNLSGKTVSLTFAHTLAMLRFTIPTGAVKYDYMFDGKDFTPYVMDSSDGHDECRYLFRPGCILDVTVKYVFDGKLYRFGTGNTKNIWPVTTKAGHCYYPDEDVQKVPYSVAVDMGTSVMWSSFNLGAEEYPDATKDNISSLQGYWIMWGVNEVTSSVGNNAYTNYNNAFTDGTKPKELPAGYDYSGDPKYDAARNLWGGQWRTPTIAEWNELYAACTYEYLSDSNSVRFTSKTTGNTITLVYAGFNNGQAPAQTNRGYYWSSTSGESNIAKANSTLFYESTGRPSVNTNADRYTGLPVRPVFTK